MALRPQSRPPVPEVTAAAVQAAFPKGHLYVALRAAFGPLYDDQLFADLYLPQGRPVDVAPWRLALVMVMQYIERLTDRQAAEAVQHGMDWKYVLSLDLMDPGFDFTLLHDFRQRLLTHEAAQPLLDTFLSACKARGWLKARGTQRTDSTHVLAAIRNLHRLACVLPAMHHALNQLSEAAPAWVRQQVPLAWDDRYGLRADRGRLRRRVSATPWRCRSARMAISSWMRSGGTGARWLCVTSPRWRGCAGFGSNTIPAVQSRGGKNSAGARRTSGAVGAAHSAARPSRGAL